MSVRRWFALVAVLALALFVAGCGDDSSSDKSSSKDSGNTPAPLKAGGTFAFCTDVPYPPAEFQEGSKYSGYEVELAEAVAKKLDTTADFIKTGFDGIIGALQAKKCDAIISSMNTTDERKKQVDFVEYMTIGQAVAVKPDAAGTINALADLAGQTVAVQVGTTLKALIDKENKQLDTKIKLKLFPDAGAAASALQTDKVDAFFADAPVVADYVNKQPKEFAIGGTQIDELPAGIALRKSDTELTDAVQKAVDELYADGTVTKIFTKYNVDSFALDDK
jgi:polar amino acid transport system substrate-binding protein